MQQICVHLDERQIEDIKELQELFKQENGCNYSRSSIIRIALYEMYRFHTTK